MAEKKELKLRGYIFGQPVYDIPIKKSKDFCVMTKAEKLDHMRTKYEPAISLGATIDGVEYVRYVRGTYFKEAKGVVDYDYIYTIDEVNWIITKKEPFALSWTD